MKQPKEAEFSNNALLLFWFDLLRFEWQNLDITLLFPFKLNKKGDFEMANLFCFGLNYNEVWKKWAKTRESVSL